MRYTSLDQMSQKQKRQVSLDDIIESAMLAMKPIFSVESVLKQTDSVDDPVIGKKGEKSREESILGSPVRVVDDLPLCKENTQICKFISCTAHNFKHDNSLSNLNLAAQLISDKKLRKTFSANPETIIAVCKDQGLTQTQCQLFTRAFQLIDRLITTIENPLGTATPLDIYERETSPSSISSTPSQLPDLNTMLMDDGKKIYQTTEHDVYSSTTAGEFATQRSKYTGSRTWSIRDRKIPREEFPMPPTLEIKTNSDRLGSFQEGEKNLDNLIEEINILARPQLQNLKLKPRKVSLTKLWPTASLSEEELISSEKMVELPRRLIKSRSSGIPEADEFVDEDNRDDDTDMQNFDETGNRRNKRENPDYYDEVTQQEHQDSSGNTSTYSTLLNSFIARRNELSGQLDCLQFLG